MKFSDSPLARALPMDRLLDELHASDGGLWPAWHAACAAEILARGPTMADEAAAETEEALMREEMASEALDNLAEAAEGAWHRLSETAARLASLDGKQHSETLRTLSAARANVHGTMNELASALRACGHWVGTAHHGQRGVSK